MAKEVAGLIKLQIKGGAANPSPPVGPALGSKGINIMEFCKQFNARTQDKAGKILPVIITYYADKSFDFVIKTPPVAIQLLEVAKVKSGSAEPNRKKVAEITWEQVRTIAQDKMFDFSDILRTYIVKQYGHWAEYKATDKTALRSFLYGRIDSIVELNK